MIAVPDADHQAAVEALGFLLDDLFQCYVLLAEGPDGECIEFANVSDAARLAKLREFVDRAGEDVPE